MGQTTRTLNPLHFEDLEPHRFEDLSRQLIYDFRNWLSIEAIGRSGADEGIDIRAIEEVITLLDENETDDENTNEILPSRLHRTWVIQCKREQKITP